MRTIEATADTNGAPLEEVIAKKVRRLPPERQREVLEFVESLAQQAPSTAQEPLAENAFIERYIDRKTDDRGPAYARLAGYGTPVWALIGRLRAADDAAQVAADYQLPPEAMDAALAYYRRYKPHLDAMILLNNADDAA